MPKFEFDQELNVSAERLWAALKDSNRLFPQIAPNFIASIDHVAGVGGQPGAVRLIKFGPVSPKGTYVKEKTVSIDAATYTIITAEIEGGHLAQGFRKWWPTMTLIPVEDKVVVEWTVSYEGGEDATEAIIDQTKDGILQLFEALDEHIVTSGEYP
ncbi:hypothetical protein Mapa_006064 [Marchantia paleacea]|nr:hypothetical protein Mapa_006064 [Marchantia paleacea]